MTPIYNIRHFRDMKLKDIDFKGATHDDFIYALMDLRDKIRHDKLAKESKKFPIEVSKEQIVQEKILDRMEGRKVELKNLLNGNFKDRCLFIKGVNKNNPFRIRIGYETFQAGQVLLEMKLGRPKDIGEQLERICDCKRGCFNPDHFAFKRKADMSRKHIRKAQDKRWAKK